MNLFTITGFIVSIIGAFICLFVQEDGNDWKKGIYFMGLAIINIIVMHS